MGFVLLPRIIEVLYCRGRKVGPWIDNSNRVDDVQNVDSNSCAASKHANCIGRGPCLTGYNRERLHIYRCSNRLDMRHDRGGEVPAERLFSTAVDVAASCKRGIRGREVEDDIFDCACLAGENFCA